MARFRRYPGPETLSKNFRSCKTHAGRSTLAPDWRSLDIKMAGQSASKFKINLFYADGQSGSRGGLELYQHRGARSEQSNLPSSKAGQ